MKAPEKLYLEVWPATSGRETLLHFQQTGYGIDVATGATSRIHVYELVKKKRRKAKEPA